jgi:hypothetical protein
MALAAHVVAFSVVPQPVWAAVNDGYCDNNEVCVYKNANLVTPRSDFLYYDDMHGGLDFHTSNSDSRVVAAFARWAKCVAQSGYDYSTPMEANDDPKWSGDKTSAEEIAVAVADVNCKKTTNLVGIRMAVDAAYPRKAISQRGAGLSAIQAALVRQAATASAILAER